MRDYLASRWAAIGNKVITIAEEFPAERYDVRPAEGARTFAEQLRHVAYWNDYCRESLEGKSPDGAANTLPADRYRSKASVLQALRNSVSGVTNAIGSTAPGRDGSDLETVEAFIEHGCEHYGQLVVYCRVNGIVPPASREEG